MWGASVRALVALALAAVGLSLGPAPVRAVGGAGVIQGTVTDGAGQPLAGIRVQVWNDRLDGDCWVHGCDGVFDELSVLTDAAGHYEAYVEDVMQETPVATVFIRDAGYESQLVRGVPAGGTADFRLIQGTAGFEPVSVTGVVRDPAGEPVRGALVVVPGRYRADLADDLTGPDGRYRVSFDPLAAGAGGARLRVGVNPRPDGYAGESDDLVDVRPIGDDEVYEPGESFAIDLRVHTATPDRPGRPRVTSARAVAPRRAVVRAAATRGDAPTRFRARCVRPAALRQGAAVTPRITVRRLQPGRAYRCQVRAGNRAGWSAWSALSPRFRTPARRR